jgi:hypothetical protein
MEDKKRRRLTTDGDSDEACVPIAPYDAVATELEHTMEEIKQSVENGNLNQAQRLLEKCADMPISIEALSKTGAGKLMRELSKTHDDALLASTAKTVVKQWKRRVKELSECEDTRSTPERPPRKEESNRTEASKPDKKAAGTACDVSIPASEAIMRVIDASCQNQAQEDGYARIHSAMKRRLGSNFTKIRAEDIKSAFATIDQHSLLAGHVQQLLKVRGWTVDTLPSLIPPFSHPLFAFPLLNTTG